MHLHCPHCRNPIELLAAEAREDFQCPSCGSSFRLEEISTTGWDPRSAQKLGKFQIIDVIGQGAFGTVYKAQDTELDRIVAIKVPRSGNLAGPQELQRFLREARGAAQLRHSSIVTIHEVGQSDQLPYLVSDFVDGITLSDWLSARRPSFTEAAELTARLAEALQYAHDQGVVHRDVKPSNIMLEPAQGRELPNGARMPEAASAPDAPLSLFTPRLMDFGLAKREAGEITMTMDGQVLGTPAYMSPKQAKGEGHKVDGRSDVYSLGVILYQLLTGELPFRGTKRMLLHQVLHDDPGSPRRLNEHIPRDLETICLKAMAKEPAQRFQRARDLADDLRRFLNGEPILARPPGTLEWIVKWIRRRPAQTAAYGLLLMVVVVGTAGSIAAWLWQDAEQAREQAEKSLQDAEQARQQAEKSFAGEQEAKRLLETALAGERSAKQLVQKAFAGEKSAKELMEQAFFGEKEAKEKEQQAKEEVQRLSYFHRIELAHRDWLRNDANEVDRVHQLLADCPINFRQWEWHYLRRHEKLLTLVHPFGVSTVAFSPDGRRLASAGWDNRVRVWDLNRAACQDYTIQPSPFDRALTATTKEALTLDAHDVIGSLAFSPDGSRLAGASMKSGAGIWTWDTQTGRETHAFPDRASVGRNEKDDECNLAFSPDGGRLYSHRRNDKKLTVWDLASGKQTASLPAGLAVPFNIDGKRFASAEDKAVKIVDLATGKVARVLSTGELIAFDPLVFSPDGKRLACCSKGQMAIWNLELGKAAVTIPYRVSGGLGVMPLAFSREGKHLAFAVFNAVEIWNLDTQQRVVALRLHANPVVNSVAFSPAGKRVATGGQDHTVKVWNMAEEVKPLTLPGENCVAFSPDSKHLATAAGETVKVWDFAKQRKLLTLTGHSKWVTGVAPTVVMVLASPAPRSTAPSRSGTPAQEKRFSPCVWAMQFLSATATADSCVQSR